MTPTALSDVSEFIVDGTHASPERVDAGIPVLSAQNVSNGALSYETDRFTTEAEYAAFERRVGLKVNDVLLTIVGTIGRAAIVHEARPAVFQRSVAIIRPKESRLDARYLYHSTHAPQFQAQLTKYSNQSAQAGIYLGKLGKVTLPLPPLDEQRRIAAILDKADALRQKRKQAIALLDSLTQSVFHTVITGREAVIEPLSSALQFVTSGGRNWTKYTAEKGGRFIRSYDVQNGSISDDDPVFVAAPDNAEATRTRTQAGDVLLTITGSRIGRASALPSELAGSYVSQHVAILRLNHAKLLPAFLSAFLISERGQTQIRKWQYGQTKPGLNFDQIRRFEIPMLPLKDQAKFVKQRALLIAHMRSFDKSVAAVNSLFASLQHRAFTGQL